MEKTLQQQYILIKEGKGNKDDFLKSARRIFPNYIAPTTDFNTAVHILKSKSILNEAVGGIVTTGRKDWFATFNDNLNEAVGVVDTETYGNVNTFKTNKETEATLKTQFDNKDPKNIDNVYGTSFLMGYYTEAKDPKNKDKSVDELKNIVLKNMSKDINYYHTNASFGVKGIGYEKMAEPKAPTGKFKSSGYGNLKENKDTDLKIYKSELKMLNKTKPTGEKQLKRKEFLEKEVAKLEKTLKEIGMFHDPIGYKKSEPNPKDEIFTKKFVGTDDNIRGAMGYIYDIFKNGTKITTIKGEGNANAFINSEKRKLKEAETRSVGSMVRPSGSEFQIGDTVIFKGVKHKVTRVEDDGRIYIKSIKYGGRPETWVKAQDLRKAKTNESQALNPYSLYSNHPEFKEAEKAITKALSTAKNWKDIQNVLDNYREVGADDTESRDSIRAIFKSKMNESYEETISKLNKDENEAFSKLTKEDLKELVKFINNKNKTQLPISWFQGTTFQEFPYEIRSAIRSFLKSKNLNESLDSSNLSKYSNNALIDMIVNLSRYKGNEDLIQMVKNELNKRNTFKESYGSSDDFEGVGLIVVGRTQIDNNEIADIVDEGNYSGVWNTREGYWFFPIVEEKIDDLEMELSREFDRRGINARFERQFNESLNEQKLRSVIRTLIKEELNEIDINDPILMKMRSPKPKPTPTKPSVSPQTLNKIKFLEKEREQLMFDMEQEAELEGGPIADMYGEKLNRIDKALNKLKGYSEWGSEKDVDISYDEIDRRAKSIKEGYGMSLEDAKAEAKRISEEEGVVQHVEETEEGSNKYRVSDWYDSDLTVVSYENGMEK